jgi:hypothetical protein
MIEVLDQICEIIELAKRSKNNKTIQNAVPAVDAIVQRAVEICIDLKAIHVEWENKFSKKKRTGKKDENILKKIDSKIRQLLFLNKHIEAANVLLLKMERHKTTLTLHLIIVVPQLQEQGIQSPGIKR